MQWKAEEHQSSHAIKQTLRRSLRSHSPSHGLPSGQQRQLRSRVGRRSHCRPHCRRQYCRRVRNPPPFLHVRKLVPHCRYPYARQFVRQLRHKRVTHPRTSSMSQHQQPSRLRRPQQQRRHLARALHSKSQLLARCHFAAILAEHPCVPVLAYSARHEPIGMSQQRDAPRLTCCFPKGSVPSSYWKPK